MSLYSDPAFYYEHRHDLQAQQDVPDQIQDLDTAFKDVLDIEKYNELEFLRKIPNPRNKVESE